MTISKEERAEWRNEAKTKNATEHRDGVRLLIALNAMESAEARAESAERERDVLAKTLADKCYDLYPDDCEYQWWNKNPWLEWARQQARGGEE